MKRRLFVTVSLSLILVGVPGGALAQQAAAPVISGNVIGDCGAGAKAGSSNIRCGDLNRAPGVTVITPAGVETGPVPVDVVPAAGPVPDAEPSPSDEPAPVEDPAAETTVDTVEANTTVESDTAVASETDLDADNYADALEVEAGLDPTNIDTDGDGVADGDEGTLYGTDPTVSDTDGDGVADGGELFDRRTDPLVWNDFSIESPEAAPEDGAAEEVAVEAVPAVAAESLGDSAALAQETNENLTATNGDAAARGNGNGSSTPGTVSGMGSPGRRSSAPTAPTA